MVSLRAGGPAQFFAEPTDAERVLALQRWAEVDGIVWTCLGGGTNLLFADSACPGLVIRTTGLRGVSFDGTQVTAAAGERVADVARLACERGLSGLEWACGIPGTVGGAIVMNAGTREGETVDRLVAATYVDGSDRIRRSAGELDLAYRRSGFLDGTIRGILIEGSFELAESTHDRTLAEAQRILDERRRKFPGGATAGCTFRNPPDGPTAGELLDRAGCKGLRVGGARVSEIHANFIVNDGTENAAEILALIESMKRRVKEAFGVDLVEEIVVRR